MAGDSPQFDFAWSSLDLRPTSINAKLHAARVCFVHNRDRDRLTVRMTLYKMEDRTVIGGHTPIDLILRNGDILPLIFRCFVDGLAHHSDDDDQNHRSNLLNAALTCKRFCFPALDCLWADMDCLIPLLLLHPAIRVIHGSYVRTTKFAGNTKPRLTRRGTQFYMNTDNQDTETFHAYARRVRSITFKSCRKCKDDNVTIAPAGLVWLGQHFNNAPLLPNVRKISFSEGVQDNSISVSLLPLIPSRSVQQLEFHDTDITCDILNSYILPLFCNATTPLRYLSLEATKSATRTDSVNSWDAALPATLKNTCLQTLALRVPQAVFSSNFLARLGSGLDSLTSLTLDIHTDLHMPSLDGVSQQILPNLNMLHLITRSGCKICDCYPPFLLNRVTCLTFYLTGSVLNGDAFSDALATLESATALEQVRFRPDSNKAIAISSPAITPVLRSLDLLSLEIHTDHSDLDCDGICVLIDAAFKKNMGLEERRQPRLRCLRTPSAVWNHEVKYPSLSTLAYVSEHAQGLERLCLLIDSSKIGSGHESISSLISSFPGAVPCALKYLEIIDHRNTSESFTPLEMQNIAKLLDALFPNLEEVALHEEELDWPEQWGVIEELRRMRKALRMNGIRW